MASLEREIETLQGNVQDMQRQLGNAHKRIHDLIAEKSSAIDKLEKERDLVKELTIKLKDTDKEASDLIQKKIDDWPDVVDSKPKSFKMGIISLIFLMVLPENEFLVINIFLSSTKLDEGLI